MNTGGFVKDNWYSAVYESGFSIIFHVVDIADGSPVICRKDGIIVDELPDGYTKIKSYGLAEPDYE